MLESIFRPAFQRYLVDDVVRVLLSRRVFSPQLLTLLAGICGVGVFIALTQNKGAIATFLLISSGYLDVVDGSLARASGTASPSGTVLDIVMDRIVEFMVIFGLFWLEPTRALLCLLMLGSILLCVTSFLVVGIFSENSSEKSFYYSPGLIERAEAFLFFSGMILFPEKFEVLAIIFVILVLLTTVIRISQFRRQISF